MFRNKIPYVFFQHPLFVFALTMFSYIKYEQYIYRTSTGETAARLVFFGICGMLYLFGVYTGAAVTSYAKSPLDYTREARQGIQQGYSPQQQRPQQQRPQQQQQQRPQQQQQQRQQQRHQYRHQVDDPRQEAMKQASLNNMRNRIANDDHIANDEDIAF